MNIIVKLLMLALFVSFPVIGKAQETAVGRGLLCDTKEQAARYIALFDEHKSAALQKVNDENTANACAIVAVAFAVGEDVGEGRNSQGAFRIVHILVYGLVTPMGVQRVPPFEQYTVFRVEEGAA